MIRYPLLLGAGCAAALMLAAHCASAASIPENIAAAVADVNRPESDKQRDANRKPAETLAFTGVKPGAKVAEMLPGSGYFTRLFSKAVGGSGHVYALVPAPLPDAPAATPDFAARVKAIAAASSNLLAQPSDSHSAKVFDPAVRGRSDQFILKFRKP